MSNGSKDLYYFYGVSVAKDRMVGYISSEELIRGMSEAWIPEYQRERILKPRKINSLVNIFKTGAPIDSVKLNLVGTTDLKDTEAVLEGRFHVIDGQQRLWSLKDSGVKSYRMPVELYVNLPLEQEVALFHQFNTDGTKLTFGELAKSYNGPVSDLVRRLMKSKSYPIHLAVNSPKLGLPLSTFCQMLYWTHRKLIRQTHIKSGQHGRHTLRAFLQDPNFTDRELEHLEFAVRNLLEGYVKLFGEYDCRSSCYKRTFMLAICHVWVDCFMTENGRLDFGRFRQKTLQLPEMFRKSYVRELMEGGGGAGAMHRMYDAVVDHYNHKIKGERLQSLQDRHGGTIDEEDDIR